MSDNSSNIARRAKVYAPSVHNFTPSAEIRAVVAQRRKLMQANGYDPVPVVHRGKGPYMRGWQSRTFDFAKNEALVNGGIWHLSTGDRHSGSAAIDIDLDDPDSAALVFDIVEATAPGFSIRQRDGSAKMALFFRNRNSTRPSSFHSRVAKSKSGPAATARPSSTESISPAQTPRRASTGGKMATRRGSARCPACRP